MTPIHSVCPKFLSQRLNPAVEKLRYCYGPGPLNVTILVHMLIYGPYISCNFGFDFSGTYWRQLANKTMIA